MTIDLMLQSNEKKNIRIIHISRINKLMSCHIGHIIKCQIFVKNVSQVMGSFLLLGVRL